jgi:hypothetical protein
MRNARTLAVVGAAVAALSAWVPQRQAPEVVVYASELPNNALSEFDFWNDAAAPGGKLVGTVNKGDELDPPPENDPHVIFPVSVDAGVAYRCWIHMKVGTPKGKSQANRLYVQFTNAVDKANKPTLKPGTGSYLTAQGPTQVGWAWVPCGSASDQIRFATTGQARVRLQAGMEGVGFDQFVLSSAKYVEKPPSEAVVPK